MRTVKTYSAEETKKLGAEFARKILAQKPGKYAVIVSLMGNLGSGKTTFIQGFLRAAGWKKRVTSPTFIIMRRHSIRHKNFKNVYHMDAYRLKPRDMVHLGFNDIKIHPYNVILVEWPENLRLKGNGKVKIKFLYGKKENERIIKISE